MTAKLPLIITGIVIVIASVGLNQRYGLNPAWVMTDGIIAAAATITIYRILRGEL